MTEPERTSHPPRDWSRVLFAVFFVFLALSFAFAHMHAVAQALRIMGIVAGAVAAFMAWRVGGRGRGILLLLITLAAGVALPAPPVPTKEEGNGVQWFFLGLAMVVLIVSLVQTFREGKKDATPGNGESSGS